MTGSGKAAGAGEVKWRKRNATKRLNSLYTSKKKKPIKNSDSTENVAKK